MNICIIDQPALIAVSLRHLLLSHFEIKNVDVYQNTIAFFEHKENLVNRRDLVIIGLEAYGTSYSAMQAKVPKAKFMILTANFYPDLIKEVFRKGLVGYLKFDTTEQELWTAIETIKQGKRYVDNGIHAFILDILLDNRTITETLTGRELEILKKICDDKSPAHIANELGISINTVQHFIRGLRKKLNVSRTSDLIPVAVKRGFYLHRKFTDDI